MYSTCFHCQSDLGRNELIETLPIGRRVAFDETTGRLWVICPKCARWNLVPFESRWETIEAGEKLYRASTMRMSTGEVGLAKTREGMELVRIGAPLRPEMAAWRYGAQFVKRRWKYHTTTGPALLLMALASQPNLLMHFATESLGLAAIFALPFMGQLLSRELMIRFVEESTQSQLPVGDSVARITRRSVQGVRIQAGMDNRPRVWLPINREDVRSRPLFHTVRELLPSIVNELKGGSDTSRFDRAKERVSHHALLEDEDAIRVLRVALPVLHESGASASLVREATAHLSSGEASTQNVLFGGLRSWEIAPSTAITNISKPRRLALEMLVHEDSERRWLAGELLDLEAEWRKANEIAQIADGLLRDPAIEAKLTALRDNPPENGRG
jgi:hypothetical protein